MRKIYLFLFLFFTTSSIWGQVDINALSTDYSQNFDALTSGTWADNSTLTGWYARTDATASIATYGVNTGSSTTAGLYSFGTTGSTERAFGYAPSNAFSGGSGSGKNYIGWRLRNNTGTPISTITVTWTGEQYRKENNAATQTLTLSYQTGATVTAVTGGTWIPASSTFSSPIVGATTAAVLDGNLPANRTADIIAIINVNIPAGEEIMLRWEDLNDSGNDHLLAIDDVTVSASAGATAPSISTASVSNITTTSATLNSEVIANGGSPITARGFVWSTTNTDPEIGGAGVTNVIEGGTTTGTFTSDLTSLPSGTTVYFKGYATNATGTAYTGVVSFSTLKLEPSNHATGFACGTTTSTSIPLSWTDATGTTVPDGYLVKWSNVDYASITDPIDGTATPNGGGALNVAAGAQAVTIVGLTQNTTYYFKIYPYTNTGSNIDYKTDGTIPQTSCATTAGLWEEFEVGTKTGYTPGDITLSSGSWNFTEALLGDLANDKKNGIQSARLRTNGVISMNFDIPTGVGYVTINHATYGTDAASVWHLEASTDGGTSWTAYIGPDITSSAALTAETFLVKIASPVRLRIVKTDPSGGRLNIDDISYTAYSPTLPVRFSALKASQKASGIQLDWNNATEENVAIYTIERSVDSRSFTTLAELAPKENGGGKVAYSFLDATPNAGDNYYRIKALETTGKTIYTNIARINTSKKGTELLVYPNPVKGGGLNVQFTNLPKGAYTVKVYAMNGQEVDARSFSHAGGSLSETFLLRNLKPGVYSLQVAGAVNISKTFFAE